MLSWSPVEVVKRHLTLRTHRVYTVPVVVLMPHSRCNCRCVMCDIWKANHEGHELSADDLARHIKGFGRLGVRSVVLSGGEPLMHTNLWTLCRALRAQRIRVTLLTTGILLDTHAEAVARWCEHVIVSLDGDQAVHDAIRRVPDAYTRLARGVQAVHRRDPRCRITARCVVQRANYRELPGVVDAAHTLGLAQISFLAADVTSTAFNRERPWDTARASDVALNAEEAGELSRLLDSLITRFADDIESEFIAESSTKLRKIGQYYLALNGLGAYPRTTCNAPWVSTVIESDGTVRPCFFHRPFGNISDAPIDEVLNTEAAVTFRRNLEVERDETCRRCVCTLTLSPWSCGAPS